MKAEIHFTTSFINSLKHNEIGVGHKINIGGWRFIFSNVFVCATGICLAKSRDLENQKLLCMCSIAVYSTKLLFLR
jgi:hypothetical protein